MIKKIQIELTLFGLLLSCIFFTFSIDVEIYNYFSKINYGTGSKYLKDFFIGITNLGDSLWYFVIFSLILPLSFLAKKINFISSEVNSHLKRIGLFSFFYLLLVGIITQIIKHLIGRPRPNHTNFEEGVVFDFFNTNSAFHSFPSGHSSTIMAIAIIASLLLPRLNIFFYTCGLIIALSRVVVGAHFITDVVSGILLSIIIYKVLDFFYKRKYSKSYWGDIKIKNVSILNKILIVFIVIAVFLTAGPDFDIFLSNFFYYGNNQFMIQSYYVVSIIFRKILIPLLLLYIFILPIISKFISIEKLFFNYKFSLKEIVYIWLSGLLTLILIINVLLKDMWGRTRPNDIIQFGGEGFFTPWYKFGDSCISNCSFVSGDSSVGFALVMFYFIIKKNIYCYLALFFGTTIGFIRIFAGGHFFSDIVFSQIVVITSLAVSNILYKTLNDK